jgi:hypothetical protein
VILPKKNGKSTLVAALAIYHLLTTVDAEGYIAANARDQANIILNQARKFIRATPALQQRIEVQMREIRKVGDEGFVRVLAADKDTADGVIPTLAIIDELHRAKSTDLMGVFRDGLGPRDGKMITITTAGDNSESPLGECAPRRMRCRRSRSTARTGMRGRATASGSCTSGRSSLSRTARTCTSSRPPTLRLGRRSICCANVARTRRLLRGSGPGSRAECGCRARTRRSGRSSGRHAAATTRRPTDLTWRLGLDAGWKEDTTAVVPWLDDDGVGVDRPGEVLVPPAQKGVALRKREVLEVVAELATEFGAREIVLDPENDGEVVAQDLRMSSVLR